MQTPTVPSLPSKANSRDKGPLFIVTRCASVKRATSPDSLSNPYTPGPINLSAYAPIEWDNLCTYQFHIFLPDGGTLFLNFSSARSY